MLRIGLAVGALGSLLLLASSPPPTGGVDLVEWHSNLQKAKQLAAKTGKPLLLTFR